MKVSLSKENLELGISTVQNAIAPRSVNPILSNVFVEAGENGLRLVATDQQVLIEKLVEGQVAEQGATTLPAKRLAEIARELPPAGTVDIKLEPNNSVELRCGKIFYRILGLSAEEFPTIPVFPETAKVTLKGSDLVDILRKVLFAAATDQSRIALTGLQLELEEGKISAVATDGRRMAYAERKVELPKGFSASALIPKKAVTEVTRLVVPEEDADICVTENMVALRFGATTLVTRLIEGHFPNYSQIIPSGYSNKVVASTRDLLSTLRRVSIMTDEKYRLTKMKVTPDRLMLRTNTPDVGDVEDELAVEYDGAEIEVGFNPYFIVDVLRTIDAEQITIELKDSASAAVLKPFGDDTHVNVVMPIKI